MTEVRGRTEDRGFGVVGPNRSGEATDRAPEPVTAGRRGARAPEARLIGYVTVDEGAARKSDAAAAPLQRACEIAGWDLVEIVTDRDSGRRSLERPGLRYALDRIQRGHAQGLVVGEITRLVRSAVDLAALLRCFRTRQAALIALDLDLDTSTAAGRRTADVLLRLGEWEHARIARRTRTALADAKAKGRPIGRPSINDRPKLRERIVEMRAGGMTLQAIADHLNADGVPTVRGGAKWRPSSIQAAAGYRRPGPPRRPGTPVTTSERSEREER